MHYTLLGAGGCRRALTSERYQCGRQTQWLYATVAARPSATDIPLPCTSTGRETAVWRAPGSDRQTRHTVRSQSFPPRARQYSAQAVPFPGRLLARQLLKLRDPHFSILEHRADLEPAAHGLDVFGQGTDTDVGPVLNLRDLSLIDAEDFRRCNCVISCAFRN